MYGETLREYLIAIAVIDVNRFRDEFCKSDKHKEVSFNDILPRCILSEYRIINTKS